jgi:hypothetical protein
MLMTLLLGAVPWLTHADESVLKIDRLSCQLYCLIFKSPLRRSLVYANTRYCEVDRRLRHSLMLLRKSGSGISIGAFLVSESCKQSIARIASKMGRLW